MVQLPPLSGIRGKVGTLEACCLLGVLLRMERRLRIRIMKGDITGGEGMFLHDGVVSVLSIRVEKRPEWRYRKEITALSPESGVRHTQTGTTVVVTALTTTELDAAHAHEGGRGGGTSTGTAPTVLLLLLLLCVRGAEQVRRARAELGRPRSTRSDGGGPRRRTWTGTARSSEPGTTTRARCLDAARTRETRGREVRGGGLSNFLDWDRKRDPLVAEEGSKKADSVSSFIQNSNQVAVRLVVRLV